MKDSRYLRYALAFHRDFVERWGARPVVYADADIIDFLYQSLGAYSRDHRQDITETEQRRLNVVRSLMVRDWPGAEESQVFFEEHRLDFDVQNTNEWSHEQEMRLIMPESSGWGRLRFYWRFEPEAVSHVLWPTLGDIEGFAEAVAADSEAQWALDTEVHLIGSDGFPRETAPLRHYLK